MIGYHYTSERNWLRIREEGLRPYVLRNDIVPDGVPGIWLFTERQRGQSHAGCVFFQIKTKRTLDVVELRVECDSAITERRGWANYEVLHDGELLDDINGTRIDYYHRNVPATIAWVAIPPEQISLLGVYRFREAWTQTNEDIALKMNEQATVAKEWK